MIQWKQNLVDAEFVSTSGTTIPSTIQEFAILKQYIVAKYVHMIFVVPWEFRGHFQTTDAHLFPFSNLLYINFESDTRYFSIVDPKNLNSCIISSIRSFEKYYICILYDTRFDTKEISRTVLCIYWTLVASD